MQIILRWVKTARVFKKNVKKKSLIRHQKLIVNELIRKNKKERRISKSNKKEKRC